MAVPQSRPSALTWALAAVELVAAVFLARLILSTDRLAPGTQHDHGMPELAVARWGWLEYTALLAAAAGLLWWVLRRQAIPALLAAAALAALAASPAVRVLAAQSHLIAMVALELLMVMAPLLILSALQVSPGARSTGWTAFAVVAGVLFAALLILIHLPAVHRRGAELGSAPLWLALVALSIGVAYWFGVLRTAGRVSVPMRRAVLIGAQEVAAFIGLLSLFGAWGAMDHKSLLGISAAWDQRLGGVFMIATCAAVAVPIARRLN